MIFIDEIERVLHDTEWADPEDWERDLSNAHLISAAPDLYAVCKEIADHLYDPQDYARVREMARVAIAKSEGRA